MEEVMRLTTVGVEMSVRNRLKEIAKEGQASQGDAVKILLEGAERIVEAARLSGELPSQKQRALIKARIADGDTLLADLYKGVDLDVEPQGRQASVLYAFHEIGLEAWAQLHGEEN